MRFWIILGLVLIVTSLIIMAVRHHRGEKHTDNQLTRLFDWPMIVTAILIMVPTWAWWDFIIGLTVMAFWEGWQLMKAKRKHAEHDYAVATGSKEKSA